MFSYFLVLTRIKEGYYEPYPEQNHFLRYHLLSIRNWLIQENSWQKLLDRFCFHSYPMPSALQLTFSLLPVGYSCSSSFPTLDGSVFPRSAWLLKPLSKVCWHWIQLMNPFPDCFSRFKFMKIHIEHRFAVCYNGDSDFTCLQGWNHKPDYKLCL